MHEDLSLSLKTLVSNRTHVHTCNPSIEEMGTGRCLGLHDQHIHRSRLVRVPAQNQRCPKDDATGCPLVTIHTYVHIYRYTHKHTCAHICTQIKA